MGEGPKGPLVFKDDDDATLPLCAVAPPAVAPDNVGAPGTATAAARCDHVHTLPTGDPLELAVGDTDDPGSANETIRADHRHGVPVDAPEALMVGGAGSIGTNGTFNHSDHVHAIPAGRVVATGSANDPGSSGAFAHSDHVHEAQVAFVAATSVVPSAGMPAAFTDIPGMSVVIGATGTYLVNFSAALDVDDGNTFEIRLALNGIGVVGTVRQLMFEAPVAGNTQTPGSVCAIVAAVATDTITAQARRAVGAGSGTISDRELNAVRINA